MQKIFILRVAAAFAIVGGFGVAANADSWKTVDPDGTVTETPVKSANEPARSYRAGDSLPRRATTGGAPIGAPNFFNPPTQPSPNATTRITIGTVYPYPYYPGYYYPYPQLPYGGPIGSGKGFQNPPWINVFPMGNAGGGFVPYPPAYPYPYGYPGAGAVPTFPTYGYPGYGTQYVPGPAWNGNGSYYHRNDSRQNGISVGRGGVQFNIGNSTRTNSGSYSTWP